MIRYTYFVSYVVTKFKYSHKFMETLIVIGFEVNSVETYNDLSQIVTKLSPFEKVTILNFKLLKEVG